MTKSIAVEDVAVNPDTNPDPITGEPGAHPVGTGLGSAGGAATGAAIGAVGGPLGAAIGGVIGAVAGGLAGHGVAEMVNPTIEDAYWRQNYPNRPYAQGGTYEQYRDAYRYGWEARSRHPATMRFPEVEPELRSGWHAARGSSTLEWDAAQQATRDAWERLEQTVPGTTRP